MMEVFTVTGTFAVLAEDPNNPNFRLIHPMQTATLQVEQALHPDLSVVIPCYNYGRFLDEAIGSVLAQTWPAVEIIVVDDGSTDPDTLALFAHFERPYTRLIRTANGGISRARNTAIRQARGEFIMTLDADDRIAPTFVEQAVRLLRQDPSLGLIYGRVEFFGDQTGPWNQPEFRMPDILFENCLPSCGVFRKQDWERVGGFAEGLPAAEDYDFWLALIELGRGVHRIDETLFWYRMHGTPRWLQDPQTRLETYRRIFNRHQALYLPYMDAWFQRYTKAVEALLVAQAEVAELREQLNRQSALLETLQQAQQQLGA